MTGQAARAEGAVRRGGDERAWTRASLGEDERGSERETGRRSARARQITRVSSLAPEPVVCEKRRGPTPSHPEPGRETRQRRRYWRDARWESRSVHPIHRGVEQWQLVGL